MRVFVTGASGSLGSTLIPELQGAGHQVLGLARSDASAEAVSAAGADVRRGDLTDLDSLRAGAAECDAVVHLAFVHDFNASADANQVDRAAVDAIGATLAGSGRPFAIASGTLGAAPGRLATEQDAPDPSAEMPRQQTAAATLALADQDVRAIVVRLAPTVHGPRDHGFVPRMIQIARDKKVSAYIDDGSSRWPAVHRVDAATLFRLAIEQAPARSVLHGVADEGVPTREIAEVIGRQLGVAVTSIPKAQADEHFEWLGAFLAMDAPASNAATRALLGWNPVHPSLLDDLEHGDYFDVPDRG